MKSADIKAISTKYPAIRSQQVAKILLYMDEASQFANHKSHYISYIKNGPDSII